MVKTSIFLIQDFLDPGNVGSILRLGDIFNFKALCIHIYIYTYFIYLYIYMYLSIYIYIYIYLKNTLPASKMYTTSTSDTSTQLNPQKTSMQPDGSFGRPLYSRDDKNTNFNLRGIKLDTTVYGKFKGFPLKNSALVWVGVIFHDPLYNPPFPPRLGIRFVLFSFLRIGLCRVACESSCDGLTSWRRFARCQSEVSHEKRAPGWLCYIGDEKLPSSVGIIISHY